MVSLTFAPLNSIVSLPSWPSIVSLPSPGFQTNVSSPAPPNIRSLPRPPAMTSLPSPPSSVSLPSPPVIVSLPAPPSMVSLMSGARPLPAVMTSSPPLALTTRFSVVPMSRLNGAGLRRSKRTRLPLAVIVKVSAPLPPLTSAVSVPSPPSKRSVPSPGFQIMRSLPASPNTWSSPAPPVSVSLPAPPNSRSLPPLPRSVSLPAWPNSMSLPEPPVSVSLPAPPNSSAAGKAPLVSSSVIVSLPPWPNSCIMVVLATVGWPPWTATAPPLIRIRPAASRLTLMRSSKLSPNTDSRPALGEKLALIAIGWSFRGVARRGDECRQVAHWIGPNRKTGLKPHCGRHGDFLEIS